MLPDIKKKVVLTDTRKKGYSYSKIDTHCFFVTNYDAVQKNYNLAEMLTY